jgi:hypothetical protein
LRKIFFPFISLFLLYQSFNLVWQLIIHPIDLSIGVSILIAFFLNLFVTGVFAFIGFEYPTNKLLPKNYYRVSKPKRLKWWYQAIGIKYFKVLLLLFFWGKEKNKKIYFGGSRNDFDNLIYQSKQSEFGHISALICIGLASGLFLFYGYTKLAFFATIINLVGNFYTIPLQRMHRMRIDRINGLLP